MRLPAPLALLLALPLALAACGGDGGASESTPSPSPTPFTLLGTPDTPSPTTAAATSAPDSGPTQTVTAQPTGELVSLDWLAGGAAYPAVPSPFPAQTPDEGLREAIEDELEGRDGRYSVIVHNLADGRYAAKNPDATYYAASLFKSAVLLETYRQRDAGALDFAKELEVDGEAAAYDLGTLEYLEIEEGDMVTVADAVKAMIVVSDTALANLVLEEVGYGAVDATLDSVGATKMSVSTTELPTTASDMYAVFAAIATGDGVSGESRAEMLNLLAQEWFLSGIVAGVPPGTPFSHKTGSFSGATHDVAIVDGPAGPYIIAVLTDRSYEWEPIADISAAVWQYFAANP